MAIELLSDPIFTARDRAWVFEGKCEYLPADGYPASGMNLWPGSVIKQYFHYSGSSISNPIVGMRAYGSGYVDVYCNGIYLGSITGKKDVKYTLNAPPWNIQPGECLLEVRARESNPSYVQLWKIGADDVDGTPLAMGYARPANIIGNGIITFTETLGAASQLWDFGDGQTSTDKNATHEFQTIGDHLITLTTPQGTKTILVSVQPPTPIARFGVSESIVIPGQVITCTEWGLRGSSYLWDFGDGQTSTDQNPTHSYSSKGTYTITLTVTNEHGQSSATKTIKVLGAPIPDFSASPVQGLTVQFSDLSLEDPTSWLWDFGENEKTLQNPVHSYQQPGTYNVTLTATNAVGSQPITKSVPVVVSEPVRPEANFFYQPTESNKTQIEFTDTSSNAPSSWLWSFGDGTTSTEQNPVHQYSTGGVYSVRLTVTNANGDATVSKTISVITPGTTPPTSGTVTPSTAQVGKMVEFTVTGTGFKPNVRIRIVHNSFRGVVSKFKSFSSSRIVFSYAFDPWFVGVNSITISNPDGSSVVIPDCITVTE